MKSTAEMIKIAADICLAIQEDCNSNWTASDGGLTIAGSDKVASTTYDLKEVVGLLCRRLELGDKKLINQLHLAACPDDFSDPGNEIAKRLLAII